MDLPYKAPINYVFWPWPSTTAVPYSHEPMYPLSSPVLESLKGWECPKCGAIYAPSEKECWRCNQPQIVYSAI